MSEEKTKLKDLLERLADIKIAALTSHVPFGYPRHWELHLDKDDALVLGGGEDIAGRRVMGMEVRSVTAERTEITLVTEATK